MGAFIDAAPAATGNHVVNYQRQRILIGRDHYQVTSQTGQTGLRLCITRQNSLGPFVLIMRNSNFEHKTHVAVLYVHVHVLASTILLANSTKSMSDIKVVPLGKSDEVSDYAPTIRR